MTIRPIQPNDADPIATLYQQSASYLRALGDDSSFLFDTKNYLQHGFGEQPVFSGIVAEIEMKLVGYLLYSFFYDTDAASKVMFILDLLVDETQRNKGFGQALIKEAKNIAKSKDAKTLFWAVYKDNNLAEQFYTKLGAKKIEDVFFMSMPAI
jgi:ribosomal protein S18 acetylase RimI-like enzyme